jgi:hypothetical protein
MPSRWATAVIIVFWVGMSAAVVRRDVMPRLGYGELRYRMVLGDRSVEEPAHWNILWNDRPIGAVTTVVQPAADGSFSVHSRATLSAAVILGGSRADQASSLFLFNSEFHVSPLGRLRRLQVAISLEGTPLRVDLKGNVYGRELELKSTGLPLIQGTVRVPIDPESLMLDPLGPIDRLPGLRPGQSWVTRSVNPLSAFLPTRGLLQSGPSVDSVEHHVVGVDTLVWNHRPWACYVIEHRYGNVVGRTWARVQNGKVLREEAPLGGVMVALELDPTLSKPD